MMMMIALRVIVVVVVVVGRFHICCLTLDLLARFACFLSCTDRWWIEIIDDCPNDISLSSCPTFKFSFVLRIRFGY